MRKCFTFATVILALIICATACSSRTEDTEVTQEAETVQELQSSLEHEIEQETELETKAEENSSSNNSFDILSKLSNSSNDEKVFADTMIDLYLKGNWDGLPIEVGGHMVSISGLGELLVDGYLTSNTKFHCQHSLDLPKQFNENVDSCNKRYIPGKGLYVLIDETYCKYLRGEKIELPGGSLNWKEGEGVDVNYGHAILHYCEYYDKMFLTTPMLEYDDGSGIPTLQPVSGPYLYIFPDYDIAEIELIGKVKEIEFDEFGPKYIDENGVIWKYRENDDGEYYFENTVH